MMWPGSLACCFCARSPCCGSFHAGTASSQAVPLPGIEPRVVCSMGSDAARKLTNPPFFVHCLGQQQRVLSPGQEVVSAVYCPVRRPLGGGRVRTQLPCRTRP